MLFHSYVHYVAQIKNFNPHFSQKLGRELKNELRQKTFTSMQVIESTARGQDARNPEE